MNVRRCPTLPQGPPCSTIGAASLSFRVRNVSGRFPRAMAAETRATPTLPHRWWVGCVVSAPHRGGVCICVELHVLGFRLLGTTEWTRAILWATHRCLTTMVCVVIVKLSAY